jgi:hypothetical protein
MEGLGLLKPAELRLRALDLCFKGKLGQTAQAVTDDGRLAPDATPQEHVERFELVLTISNTRLPLTSLAITYC